MSDDPNSLSERLNANAFVLEEMLKEASAMKRRLSYSAMRSLLADLVDATEAARSLEAQLRQTKAQALYWHDEAKSRPEPVRNVPPPSGEVVPFRWRKSA
jgi:hypothetical protein